MARPGLPEKLVAAAGAALALAGCATRPPPEEAWISGRLSVRVEATADRPASSVTADFDLRGDHEQGELRLSSPLGTRIANARWNSAGAELATGQGEARYPDLETLSREALGEALPLRAFPDWLAGRPWTGSAHVLTPTGFVQMGWQVALARLPEGWIEAVRPAPPMVTVRVRREAAPS